MIRFFNRGSTSVECVEKGVYRVNDSVDYTEELKILGKSCILNEELKMISVRQIRIYRAGGKRKHERSEYLLFLARYRQNRKCEARQTRSGWILEV